MTTPNVSPYNGPELICFACQWEDDCIGETVYMEDGEWECDWFANK